MILFIPLFLFASPSGGFSITNGHKARYTRQNFGPRLTLLGEPAWGV